MKEAAKKDSVVEVSKLPGTIAIDMNLSKYRCPNCLTSQWRAYSTLWICQNCERQYACVNGIPRLYLEDALGSQDKKLRDKLYNGFLGTYYQRVMPFLSLPVRPASGYWFGWVVYALIVLSLISIISYLGVGLAQGIDYRSIPQLTVFLLFLGVIFFFYKHPYLFYLIFLALPVKITLLFKKFEPDQTFQQIHADAIQPFLESREQLQVLDISTGTCNSLYRHGWMKLNAEYTGLDLSETMLLQGQKFMAEQRVPIDFVLADATHLPFETETFDIVLNYGAINGFTNPKLALDEMARVTRKDGLVLFLDEQLYERAGFFERLYFKKVLSSHNVIHRCPVELLPENLGDIKVHQVYHFYYICSGRKK